MDAALPATRAVAAVDANRVSDSGGTACMGMPYPKIIFVLALGTFVIGTYAFFVAAFIPALASQLGVSGAIAGQSATVFTCLCVDGASHGSADLVILANAQSGQLPKQGHGR